MSYKRPWNRVNLPVYSIASRHKGQTNMNIITYVSQVSMQPKLFHCAVYHNTQTLENIAKEKEFVLQLLAASQYRLVNLLGRQSGKKVDKTGRLNKRNALMNWQGYPVLKEALALIRLQVIRQYCDGDHTCFVCSVTAYKNLNSGEPLTLDELRKHKLIRN
ncbi:MAG: flavin reductase family protein [Ferruginibacter sp.]